MKKIGIFALALGMLAACSDEPEMSAPESMNNPEISHRAHCPSDEIRKQSLNADPELMQRYLENEKSAVQFENDLKMGKVLADGTVEIPVVVNVLYRTSAENLSQSRIAEQIAVLNADFAGSNSDVIKIPTEFQGVKAGNTKISFRLHNIVRKSTTKTSWSTNDAMKRTSTGGINATSPTNYLNIWVVGSMGGVLGYATFPESAGRWNDGIVLAAPYVGKTGASAPFNLGRTATHEVGHYLNLRHIWGDGNCATDYVADTPTQTGANSGKPTYPRYNTCSGVRRSIQFMNYMDYVDDAAMFMFSAGQRTRMQASVTSTGARKGLRLY